MDRGDPGNKDSPLSDSLAQSKSFTHSAAVCSDTCMQRYVYAAIRVCSDTCMQRYVSQRYVE